MNVLETKARNSERVYLRKNLTGLRYGRLVALEPIGRDHAGQTIWRCICDCGNRKDTTAFRLLSNYPSNKTRSCGCLQVDVQRARKTTHGLHEIRDGKRSSVASAWLTMKQRATNPKNRDPVPIEEIHPPWLTSFAKYYEDNGPPPEWRGWALVRIDVTGNFEPGNMEWITQREHCRRAGLHRR